MRAHVNELYAAEIRKFRRQYITDATRAVVDADMPADVVRGAAFMAGLQWTDLHPHLASRIEEES
jgi:hypothetical protein